MAAMKKVVKITGTAKSTGGSAKNIKMKPLGASSDKAQLKAAAKKVDPMKASAASHQKGLARIAGTTAAVKAGKNLPEAGRNERIGGRNAQITIAAFEKALKQTLKSFK
jgi:hypothetical protein